MSVDVNTIRHLQQENIRLKTENSALQNHLARLQKAIHGLTKLQYQLDHIQPNTNVYELINNILEASLDAVDSENGSLALLDEESGNLVFVEVIGPTRDHLLNFRLPAGQGVAGWCVVHKKPRLVEDVRKESAFSPVVDQMTGLLTNSLICIPLLDNQRPLGVVEVVNTRSGRPFNESDLQLMMVVGKLSSLAIVAAEKMATGG